MRAHKGFAIVELLFVIAITAIITVIALGPLQRFYNRYSVLSEHENARQLFYDSSTSSHVYEQVLVCPSADGKKCATAMHSMLIAFVDVNGNQTKEEQEQVLYALESKLHQDKIELNAFSRHNNILIARPETLSSSNFTKKHADAVLKMSNSGALSKDY